MNFENFILQILPTVNLRRVRTQSSKIKSRKVRARLIRKNFRPRAIRYLHSSLHPPFNLTSPNMPYFFLIIPLPPPPFSLIPFPYPFLSLYNTIKPCPTVSSTPNSHTHHCTRIRVPCGPLILKLSYIWTTWFQPGAVGLVVATFFKSSISSIAVSV